MIYIIQVKPPQAIPGGPRNGLYLRDENGLDAVAVIGSGLAGLPDEQLCVRAAELDRLTVTFNNPDFVAELANFASRIPNSRLPAAIEEVVLRVTEAGGPRYGLWIGSRSIHAVRFSLTLSLARSPKNMGRTLLVALFFFCPGCGSDAPLRGLRIGVESGGRRTEAQLGALRLDLEKGYELHITSCASESKRVRIACTILQDGRIIDEPDFGVDVNSHAEFSANLGPIRPVPSGYRATCPMMSEFTRFESPIEPGSGFPSGWNEASPDDPAPLGLLAILLALVTPGSCRSTTEPGVHSSGSHPTGRPPVVRAQTDPLHQGLRLGNRPGSRRIFIPN
jgi:hypothetical protein